MTETISTTLVKNPKDDEILEALRKAIDKMNGVIKPLAHCFNCRRFVPSKDTDGMTCKNCDPTFERRRDMDSRTGY